MSILTTLTPAEPYENHDRSRRREIIATDVIPLAHWNDSFECHMDRNLGKNDTKRFRVRRVQAMAP